MDRVRNLSSGSFENARQATSEEEPQRHRGHRRTQRATQGRSRRSPTHSVGSEEGLSIALDARRPIEVQAFSTRASPAWANQSDALMVRSRPYTPEPGCTRSVMGLKERRVTRTGSWSPVLFEPTADEVRVPGGTHEPFGTLLCVLCVSVVNLPSDSVFSLSRRPKHWFRLRRVG